MSAPQTDVTLLYKLIDLATFMKTVDSDTGWTFLRDSFSLHDIMQWMMHFHIRILLHSRTVEQYEYTANFIKEKHQKIVKYVANLL